MVMSKATDVAVYPNTFNHSKNGAIIVFAKCPIPHVSKTRLSGLIGPDGAACLAQAMLSDILLSISHSTELNSIMKVLVYAPGDEGGETHMANLLKELDLPYSIQTFDKEKPISRSKWRLLPMLSSTSSIRRDICLTSSNLGTKLKDALNRVRSCLSNEGQVSCTEMKINSFDGKEELSGVEPKLNRSTPKNNGHFAENNIRGRDSGPVVFLGMDAPELSLHEIAHALHLADNSNDGYNSQRQRSKGRAYLNPAVDGGYGMLCVPSQASSSIFDGVRWSCALTAVSQLKSITDDDVDITLGSLMNDVDTADDVRELAIRLCAAKSALNSGGDTAQGHVVQLTDVDKDVTDVLKQDVLDLNFKQNTTLSPCPKTFDAMIDLGLIEEKVCTNHEMSYVVKLERWTKSDASLKK